MTKVYSRQFGLILFVLQFFHVIQQFKTTKRANSVAMETAEFAACVVIRNGIFIRKVVSSSIGFDVCEQFLFKRIQF